MNSEEPLNPKIIIVITKQVNELMKKSPDGVTIIYNEMDMMDFQADIEGPVDTPYCGGVFRCKLIISSDFPRSPPKGYFLTKIFHPNVSEKGEICVNTLKKDWDPKNWSFYNILEVIKCLMIYPFPESALNENAAKLFMDNYQEYFKHAKLLTELHAVSKEKRNILSLSKTTSVEPVFHSKNNTNNSDFFSPFKTNNSNPLSTSLDIENFQALASYGKSKENTMNSYSLNNGIGFLNTNSVMSEHFNNSNNNNEEVLTTVTNFSTLSGSLKQQISYETGNKKENEKKKWMKRI